MFGLFAGLGILSKYLFIYLLIALDVFFIYLIINKKFSSKCFISLISFFIVLLPHLIWLVDNDYTTITYALHRTGIENSNFFINHISYPLIFLGKQIGILIPFFIMFFFIISKFKPKINLKDKKINIFNCHKYCSNNTNFFNIIIHGSENKNNVDDTFLLIHGCFIYISISKKIVLNKLKYFFSIFLILFIFSPIAYFYISITQTDKRTDYPGKRISQVVQEKWENNFTNKIKLVGGDEWHGGNLSYHLKSRPIWDNILEAKENTLLKDIEGGFVLVGNANILKNICSGEFLNVDINTGKVKTLGICMIGTKK